MKAVKNTRPALGVFQDLEANSTSRHGPTAHPARPALSDLFTLRVLSVVLFRLAQKVGRLSPTMGSFVKQINQALTGADLAWQATIGTGLVLRHPVGVVIGPHVTLGDDATLQQGVTLGGDGGAEGGMLNSPTIGSRVSFGAGCRVIGAISIGDDVRIGANAVVITNIEPGSTAVGVPARQFPTNNV